MTFFYMLLAFVVGLLLGWFLWGRQRGELDGLRKNLDSVRGERDRLAADTTRLKGELDVCGRARADLERQVSEAKAGAAKKSAAKAAPASASLMSAPAASASPSSSTPKKSAAPAAAKSAKATATTAKPAKAASAKASPAKASATKMSPAKASSAKASSAKAASTKATAANSSGKDNLRRLIGIGPVNERKLNGHGITTFAQIAAWKAADIKRVEEYLEFDGRIERERWVEQAKLLAAGNEKEFARRFPTAGDSNNS